MNYDEFLERIDDFVNHVVEFTSRFKADRKEFKTQRFVWDNKEFGQPSEDSLIEVVNVEDLGEKKINTTISGVKAV